MLVIGSMINIIAFAAGLLMLGLKAGVAVSLTVLFAPIPCNILLLVVVWRAADLADARKAGAYRLGATLWFVAAAIV